MLEMVFTWWSKETPDCKEITAPVLGTEKKSRMKKKNHGNIIFFSIVKMDDIYDEIKKFRIKNLPAFSGSRIFLFLDSSLRATRLNRFSIDLKLV
jgi:hypothetical protein